MDLDLSLNMFESEVCWTKYHTNKNVVASGEYLDHLFIKIQQAIENAKDMDVSTCCMHYELHFPPDLK